MSMKCLLLLVFLFSSFSTFADEKHELPIVTILSPLRFADFSVTGPVTKSMLRRFTLKKINADSSFPHVSNCIEYWKYGINAETTYEMSMASFFQVTCGSLNALLKVKKPLVSYLKNIPLADAELMSPTMLPVATDDAENRLKELAAQGMTVADLIKSGKAKMVINSAHSITLYYGGMELGMNVQINEIARGDFTGNGVESMLVTMATYANEGTYRVYNTALITRSSKNALFHVITLTR